ncbi:hypothetical protein [Streptomyces phaeochromogenes]
MTSWVGRGAQQPTERRDVQSGPLQPEVQVAAPDVLAGELHRTAAGQRDPGHRGKLGRDLHGGVARTHHDDPLPGERLRAAVVGGMQQRAAVALQAG